MKVTQWFMHNINPVHVGEYEVYREGIVPPWPKHSFLYWDGLNWFHTDRSSNGQFIGCIAGMACLMNNGRSSRSFRHSDLLPPH